LKKYHHLTHYIQHTSRSAATTIDSTSFWNRAEYEKLEFITSHELLSNFEGFELDIPSLGGNEKHAAAQQ
jgi:hypothetical protein